MTSAPQQDDLAVAGPVEFGQRFAAWADEHTAELDLLLEPDVDYDRGVETARRLRALLWESGWGRFGWAPELGGLGGTSVHRAVVYEELFRRGWGGPAIFEHVEIVGPTIARYAQPAFAAEVLPRFLDGSAAWAQGFSEPESGSDLASLRTRAVVEGDDFVVSGSKIWTSWSKWARWCLTLVRTGTAEERHRGLTMVVVDLQQPGVTVSPIRQANGTDELAAVFFDEVRVPRARLVGEVGQGWRVAMYLLARERGTLSWIRLGGFREQLQGVLGGFGPADDADLGEFAVQWAGVRAAAALLLRRDSEGQELGAESAFNKLLMTRAEQQLFNLLGDLFARRIALPLNDDDALLDREYLFSRVVTVYGGTQQMQLMTIARHVLGLGHG